MALAVGFAGLGLYQAWHDSPTFDEPVYVAAGLTSLTRHDLRLNPEHPPLAKALAALPALAVHPVIPHTAAWRRGDERIYSAQFLQAQLEAGTLQRVMFAARLVPLAEAIAAAFVLYALGRRLLSPSAGLVAGGLWLAGPVVLGLGHLDGIDLPFTLAALLVSLALVRVLELPRLDPRARRRSARARAWPAGWPRWSRTPGLILAALAPAVVAVSGWRDRRWATLVDAIGGGAGGLGVHLGDLPGHRPGLGLAAGRAAQAGSGRAALPVHQRHPVRAGLPAGVVLGGWPVVVLAASASSSRCPLVTVALLLVGPVGLAWVKRSVRRRTLAAVVLPAVAIAAFTVPGPRDIGVRYLLPVLALWLVVAAAVTQVPRRRARSGGPGRDPDRCRAGHRHRRTPTPSPGCRPPFQPGYRAASDSNVDWGQDFYRLQVWSAGRHPAVAYFGPRGLSAAQVPGARELARVPAGPPDRLGGGLGHAVDHRRPRLGCPGSGRTARWAPSAARSCSTGSPVRPDPAPGPDRPAALCPSGTTFSARPPGASARVKAPS